MGQFWEDQITGSCVVCKHDIHENFSNKGVYKECTICLKYICRECFGKCISFFTCLNCDCGEENCIQDYKPCDEEEAEYYCTRCVEPSVNENEEDKSIFFYKNFEKVLDIETGQTFLDNKINCQLVEDFIKSQDFQFNKENFMQKLLEYSQQKWIIFEDYNLGFDLDKTKSFQRSFKCPTKFKKYCTFSVANTLKGKLIKEETNDVGKKRKVEYQEEEEEEDQEKTTSKKQTKE